VTDFVVIGGGIAGASAAAHLSGDASVLLLERETTMAYHTSGRSAAMLVENYGSAGARPLVKAARPFLEEPPEGSVDAPLLSPRAILWVSPVGGTSHLEEIAEEGRANGANARLLDSGSVVEMAPIMRPDWVGGGLFEESGADIDVAGLHQAYVRIARGNGAELRTKSPVSAIERDGSGWKVAAGDDTITCGAIVDAAGAWGDLVARMAGVEPIGLQPMRRTAFMVPGRENATRWPMIVEADERWYLKPDGVQFLCSLAEETPSDPMDARPRMEDVALAIERINEATNLEIRTVNSQWAGLRTFAPDRDLVIGEDPTAPGFFWLVGQGGIGIQTSPAYGALLEALALGKPLPTALTAAGVDPARTDPARLRGHR
jgi:D-arginine dehydrogenase